MRFLDILNPIPAKKSNINVDSVFKMPIDYLEESDVYDLSPVVASDLELDSSQNGEKSVYEIALKPQHSYATSMISRVKTKYTTHAGFLQNTQEPFSSPIHSDHPASQTIKDSLKTNPSESC